MNTALHQQLINACTLFNTALKYEERVSALEAEIKKYESKYQQMKKRGFRATPGVLRIAFLGGGFALISVIAISVYMSVLDPTQVDPAVMDMVVVGTVLGGTLTPVFLVLASLLYRNTYCKAKTKTLQKEAQKYWDEVGAPACEKIRAQILVLRQEQKDYVSKNFDLISFVPEAYRIHG